MATRTPDLRGRAAALLAVAGSSGAVLASTAVETAALIGWSVLGTGSPTRATATLGPGVLVAGLLLADLLVDLAVGDTESFPGTGVVLSGVSGALLWVAWRSVADGVGGVAGPLAAGAALAVLSVPRHTVRDNVLNDLPALSVVLDFRTLRFGVVEAAGATVWLATVRHREAAVRVLGEVGVTVDPSTVGATVLAGALLVGRAAAVSFARR